jgi:hypothetical protein
MRVLTEVTASSTTCASHFTKTALGSHLHRQTEAQLAHQEDRVQLGDVKPVKAKES